MALGVAALVLGGVAAWGFIQFNRIDRVGVDLAHAADMAPQNFLVVGSDTRDLGNASPGQDNGQIYGDGRETAPGGKRADTILIARIDPRRASIELLSVPRDLWVERPDGTTGRINAAYNKGPQQLIDTIQDNLDIPINHYVEVDFNGFKGLVEAIGGIDMYFDRPVYDDHSGLNIRKKGCYTLDGVQALAFARSRDLVYSNGVDWVADPTGDLGRITRQQVFLRRALAKVATFGLDDLGSLQVLTGVAVNNVTIDDEMGSGEMISLARRFSKFDPASMVVHRLTTEPLRVNGKAVLQLSKAPSQPVLDIFNGKAAAASKASSAPATTWPAPSSVTVDVLNGAGVAGLARQGADLLEGAGFAIGEVGNTGPVRTTAVSYGKGGEAAAMLVASKISPTPEVEEDASLSAGAVRVKLAGELDLATGKAASGGSTASATPASNGGGSAPQSSTTPEPTVGLDIGDPPPGVKCGP